MAKRSLSGRQFLRLMANNGIPASALAAKANTSLDKIRRLGKMSTVPQWYVKSLLRNYSAQLSQVAKNELSDAS